MGYPPYAGAVVRSPLVDDAGSRAVRTAWLERRFPDSGSRDAREATQKRRAAAALWLLTAAFVAFIVWVVVNGVPAPPDGRAPWLAEVFLVMTAVWLAIAVALAFVTRARPDVAEADVDILGRLTRSERQALVADMRATTPPDPDDLDVVAAAWLKSRTEVLFLYPLQVLVGTNLAMKLATTPWVVLVVLAVAWPLWGLVDGVPRLLAARAWLRRRAAHDAVPTG